MGDLYDIFGTPWYSEISVINIAYKELLPKYHGWVSHCLEIIISFTCYGNFLKFRDGGSGGDIARFQLLQLAVKFIRDPILKTLYDCFAQKGKQVSIHAFTQIIF